jgi:death-on-curing protein
MDEPIWIFDEVVARIHQRQLDEHGGAPGVRDTSLLSSALMRPRHMFVYAAHEATLSRLAAAYAFGIARNHPFIDGNKRTAFVVALLFLRINGYAVVASQEEKYQTFLALAEGQMNEANLSAWFTAHCRPDAEEERQ